MASVRTLLLFDWPLLMLIVADEGEVVKQVLVCNKGVLCGKLADFDTFVGYIMAFLHQVAP